MLPGPQVKWNGDKKAFTDAIRDAVHASKIISYTQGYLLMRGANAERLRERRERERERETETL